MSNIVNECLAFTLVKRIFSGTFFFTSQWQGTFLGYNNILTSKKKAVIINHSIFHKKSYFGTTQIEFPTFLVKIRRPRMSKKLVGRNNVKKSQI